MACALEWESHKDLAINRIRFTYMHHSFNFYASLNIFNVFLISACFATAAPSEKQTSQRQANLMTQGIVFTENESRRFSTTIPFMNLSSEYWTPSAADVNRLEDAFPEYIKESGGKKGIEILGHAESYKRQYFGYTKHHSPWIFVNGFCSDYWKGNSKWHIEPVIVMDGGHCFFQVHYNVKTGRFHDLYINENS